MTIVETELQNRSSHHRIRRDVPRKIEPQQDPLAPIVVEPQLKALPKGFVSTLSIKIGIGYAGIGRFRGYFVLEAERHQKARGQRR